MDVHSSCFFNYQHFRKEFIYKKRENQLTQGQLGGGHR